MRIPCAALHISRIEKLAEDFCRLPLWDKQAIASSLDLLKNNEYNLPEYKLEVLIWLRAINQNKYDDLEFEVSDMYARWD